MKKLKWPLLVVSAMSSLGMSVAKAGYESLSAVANINGWVGASADYLHNKRGSGAGGIGDAGIVIPFIHDIAGQLHAYDGAAGGTHLESIDGYIFYRDPEQGLLGPHVTYTQLSHFRRTLYGLHGEAYLNRWTLTGEGGGVARNHHKGTYYGEAIVNWYANPNWRLYVGGIVIDGNGTGQVGTEYQFGFRKLPGLSIFADAGAGVHSLSYGFLGLRYYFGDICNPCKPLIRRHREDMVPPTLDPLAVNKNRKSVSDNEMM